jgi:asparagine synthase (glutamine-hydrolysing)
MCGIAGILSLTDGAEPPSRAELERMAAVLDHRGPDERGVVVAGRAGLAHTRLAIIDLSGGRQPMASDDASVVLSYNGEVFDYVELRAELEARGRTFRTSSDTEVVLRAWEEWGEDAFARFNGQFAIAIWDARRGVLVLARDRLGIRPLYTCEHRGRLYFASEVKAIFAADRSIRRALDPRGIDETFTFWTVVAPRTAFEGVSEVRPGHVRVVGPSGAVERPFWSPTFPMDLPPFRGTLADAVDEVRAALERATSLRLFRSDVPVGAYLSGGLDSSLVTALARRASPRKLSTFSVRFEEADLDEGRFQRVVASELGTDHHEIVVRRGDIARVFPKVVEHAERPILRTAPAPLFLLSSLVRDSGIKVVLTGEGADETFAGYDLFREGKVRRFWAKHPGSTFRPLLLERLYPYLSRSPVGRGSMARSFFGHGLADAARPGFAHDTRWRTTKALARLLSPELRARIGDYDARAALLATLPEGFSRWEPLAQDQYLEMRTLLSGYLLSAQGDRMLMGHSVEGRFPFLDRDLVTLAASLPPSFKLRVLDEKHVVKRAARGLVPAAVIARTKQPYRAPAAPSFVGPGAPEWAADALSERALADAGVFEPALVARLVAKCAAAAASGHLSNSDNMALVGVLSTQVLHRTFAELPEVPT